MHDSRKVYLFLVLCLLFGLLVCAGCSQKAGPGAIVTDGQTVSIPVSPGQPDPGTTGGTCPVASQIWCNGRCIDPATDMGNCGGCMNPCQPGQPCINGKCGFGSTESTGITACEPGLALCNGHCMILATDPSNCGSCGTVCPGGQSCTGGMCSSGVPGITATSGTPGTTSCTSGTMNCYGSCVDLQSDTGHCGTCNTKCASGKVCSAGSCTITCSAGQNNCGGSCINTQTSSQHCGKCNNPCSSGQTCQNGKCGLYASVMTLNPQDLCVGSGKLWCSGACISQDATNCGLCGNVCKVGESCSQGKCLSWTGTWTGTWTEWWDGGSKSPKTVEAFSLVQTGTSVKGTFTSKYGSHWTYTFEGDTVGNPPRVISGDWENNFYDYGSFQFTMSADGKQFTGWTTYAGQPEKYTTTFARK